MTYLFGQELRRRTAFPLRDVRLEGDLLMITIDEAEATSRFGTRDAWLSGLYYALLDWLEVRASTLNSLTERASLLISVLVAAYDSPEKPLYPDQWLRIHNWFNAPFRLALEHCTHQERPPRLAELNDLWRSHGSWRAVLSIEVRDTCAVDGNMIASTTENSSSTMENRSSGWRRGLYIAGGAGAALLFWWLLGGRQT